MEIDKVDMVIYIAATIMWILAVISEFAHMINSHTFIAISSTLILIVIIFAFIRRHIRSR